MATEESSRLSPLHEHEAWKALGLTCVRHDGSVLGKGAAILSLAPIFAIVAYVAAAAALAGTIVAQRWMGGAGGGERAAFVALAATGLLLVGQLVSWGGVVLWSYRARRARRSVAAGVKREQ